MSQTYIPKALRTKVAKQARYRCGYCLTREAIIGMPMQFDHIIPEALGGPTVEDNLWLACSLCNAIKGDRISAVDPITAQIVTLFNPRHQNWLEHFVWSKEADLIIGLTEVGRATVEALQLNRELLVQARKNWIIPGWHPPKD